MNTKLAAFVIAFVALITLLLTVKAFRRNKLPTRIFLMWTIIWLGIGGFALFPSLLYRIAAFLNMGVTTNFIMISGIFILFIILFYLSDYINNISRKLTKLTQDIAILNYELEKLKTREEKK